MTERNRLDRGQSARFRRWQDRTFYVDPRKVVWARRYAALVAIALVALVVGLFVMAIRTSTTPKVLLMLALNAPLILWGAWRLASFALSGPPPTQPRLPTEFRLCPVCGSILRPRHLENGWTAVCPACAFRMPLED